MNPSHTYTHSQYTLCSTVSPHPFLPLLIYTQSVYDFAMTCEQLPHHLTLVTNFPRKELVCDGDGGPQLQHLGLGRRCILFVQDNSEDD